MEDDLRIICYGRPNSLVRGYSWRFVYVGGIRNHPEDSRRDEILRSLSSIIFSHLILYLSSPLSKPLKDDLIESPSDKIDYVRKFAGNLV